jgi:DNA invertase Pin-like site-specific DNA recombinase
MNMQINDIQAAFSNKKQYNAGIYTRLSVDDTRNRRKKNSSASNESMSVANQREVLSRHAVKMGWHEKRVYMDDGWSGSNFDRPGFKEMIEDVKNGTINLILVKDLSRFGRNYIEVGRYTDFILPSLGCRFVALDDGIDTQFDDNEILPFRSIVNDYYLKDMSNKIKAAHKTMAYEGKRVSGRPPYGYLSDPDDYHRFIIDEYAAGVIRRIYSLRLDGISYGRIAGALNADGILSPRAYEYQAFGKPYPYKGVPIWLTKIVKSILTSETYIGNKVQCKSVTLSYRSTKVVQKPPEEWVRVENVHEPIIDAGTWHTVQEINKEAAKKSSGKPKISSLFRGMLRCADCGGVLTYSSGAPYKLKSGEVKVYANYQCVRHAQTGNQYCSSHHIKESALKQIILADIQKHANSVMLDKGRIAAELKKSLRLDDAEKRNSNAADLKRAGKRLRELEQKESRLYEDKVSGVISAQIFDTLIQAHVSEVEALKIEQIRLLEQQTEYEGGESNIANWLEMINKHGEVRDVDRELLESLIDKIEIGRIVVCNEGKQQNVTIYYKHIGALA